MSEKQMHAILTHQNKMCALKVKDFPQILPYNELPLTTRLYSLDSNRSSNFVGTEVQFRKMKSSEMKVDIVTQQCELI